MRTRLLRLVSTTGAALSLMLLALPQAASAQIIQANPTTGANPESIVAENQPAPKNQTAPITLGPGPLDKSRHIVVNISDTGFDAASYTVTTTSGTGNGMNSNGGTVEFKNTGTLVHTATWVQGSGNLQVHEDQMVGCSRSKCTGTGPLDTGGISPGQSVVVSVAYQTGSIQITSQTDCLNGNTNPSFNCTPSTLTVKGAAQDSMIAGSMEGTILHNADGTLSQVRTLNSTKGSAKAPLTGSVTVTIDDEKGYDPTTLYVLAGTNVTWVNNGQMIHAVRPRAPAPPTVDWVSLLDSGGLAPGASYSYLFDCAPDPGCRHMGAGNSKFYSVIIDDRIQGAVNGNSNVNFDSRFMQRINTVAQPS